MPPQAPTEFLMIRHAPSLDGGRMAGRRDVAADCSDLAAFGRLKGRIGAVDHLITSPAKRCLQTASLLAPRMVPQIDPRLWEQDFGDHEGMAHTDLPDLGPMTRAQIAAHQPPNGESFNDVYDRALPALAAVTGRSLMVVHAGIIRVALSWALSWSLSEAGRDGGAGLAFHIAPLSLTRITRFADGEFAIGCVNWTEG